MLDITAEGRRLAALHRLDALDRPRDPDLDALARIAAYICDAPTAVVNLIDADRQFSAAAHGYEPSEVSREASMCAVSIASRDISYSPDASQDERWRDSPFVTGELGLVRLYAAAPLIVAGGEVVGTVCAFDDRPRELTRLQLERLRDVADHVVRVLELRETASQMRHAATRDPLTGLPNRALFTETLELTLARAERAGTGAVVVFIDLDDFKPINDTLGHAAGDEVLRAVADRLVHAMRVSDLIARLGGDEFVMLCETTSGNELGLLLDRVRTALAGEFAFSFGARTIGASIGGADWLGSDETAASLISRADHAMYADKRARRADR